MFHWSVDNYGSKATPVMGGIIDAFQGHHKDPWTITKRQFANNIHTTCPATMCVTVPLLLTPGLAPDTCAFMGVFCSMIVLSQQFHAWSHMKKSQLPEIVVKLQDLGVLISRKGHGAHHRPPFEGNYCIVFIGGTPSWTTTSFSTRWRRWFLRRRACAEMLVRDSRLDVEEEAPRVGARSTTCDIRAVIKLLLFFSSRAERRSPEPMYNRFKVVQRTLRLV